MAVGYQGLPELHPVAGVRLGTAMAGIKKPGRRDVVVMELLHDSSVAAVFTRNAFCAAPVTVAKEHLAAGTPRYLLVNTGNANAGTGADGLAAARQCCEALAGAGGVASTAVLPFSTGVIGEPLPVEKIVKAVPYALADLSEAGWAEAAEGIMTTDTVPKGASQRLQLLPGGQQVTITGIAKGSGMIHPNMATMLAYVATDAVIEAGLLQQLLAEAVKRSFNRVSVDGDTSTNDACVLVATGASGVVVEEGSEALESFSSALDALCLELAQLLVRDGEGASKFIAVRVSGGSDEAECEQVAFTIAHSPLVKTALFASDPNWGRILAAVGRAGVEQMELEKVSIYLDGVCIVSNGARDPGYREEAGQAVMDGEEITIHVDLARGDAEATVWTCDLSHEYVRINAEYRT